ncbi:MAG: alpha/beta hydrolase [Flavobacteriales bacterium]|nr:alpha/beta hydrolase [Flavobacteriales bacterium]
MAILIWVLVLLFGAYAVLCAFYWLFQERFIFVRFRLKPSFVFKFPASFEERWTKAPDGAELHGLYFRTESPRGVVLYFHGNTGSLRRWGPRATRFLRLGHDVFMPDYRGYGKSRGKLNEAALHADAERWYQELLERWPEERITIYGRSLGTGFAVPLAAAHRPRGLILESPFANFIEVARHYLSILPYRLILRYPFRSDKAMLRVKCPVYIFHGKRDPVVPYATALRLYSLVPPDVHREMFSFAKGYHNDLAQYGRFKRALRRILTEPAPGEGVKPS